MNKNEQVIPAGMHVSQLGHWISGSFL